MVWVKLFSLFWFHRGNIEPFAQGQGCFCTVYFSHLSTISQAMNNIWANQHSPINMLQTQIFVWRRANKFVVCYNDSGSKQDGPQNRAFQTESFDGLIFLGMRETTASMRRTSDLIEADLCDLGDKTCTQRHNLHFVTFLSAHSAWL